MLVDIDTFIQLKQTMISFCLLLNNYFFIRQNIKQSH